MSVIVAIFYCIYRATPEFMMPKIKARIPEAYEFFYKHKDILTDIVDFAREEIPEDTSSSEYQDWDYFDDAQKEILTDFLRELEENNGWISIHGEIVTIFVVDDLYVNMIIINAIDWMPLSDNNSRDYYSEKIEGDWYLEIFYSPKI